MKLFVCGEGASDVGGDSDGVVGTLLRRCLGAGDIEIVKARLSQLPADRKRTGEARRASTFIDEGRLRQCDGLVFVRDGDGRADERRAQLEHEFAEIEIPCVLAVAVQTIEAWLLADPDATRRVIHREPALPKPPEQLWGAAGRPGHPKFEWNQLCRDARHDHGVQTQVAVAEHVSIERLRAQCPAGFARFHDDLLRAFPAFDIVVAADAEWGIGNATGLPWPKLKSDLAHFKRITGDAEPGKRNAVIMGRKTWESKEVARRPLPRRLNIIISRNRLELPDGVLGARSLTQALFRAAQQADIDQIHVVGGAEIYRQALAHPRLRYAYLTRVRARFDTDTKIPDLDRTMELDRAWSGGGRFDENGYEYDIERLTPRPGT